MNGADGAAKKKRYQIAQYFIHLLDCEENRCLRLSHLANQLHTIPSFTEHEVRHLLGLGTLAADTNFDLLSRQGALRKLLKDNPTFFSIENNKESDANVRLLLTPKEVELLMPAEVRGRSSHSRNSKYSRRSSSTSSESSESEESSSSESSETSPLPPKRQRAPLRKRSEPARINSRNSSNRSRSRSCRDRNRSRNDRRTDSSPRCSRSPDRRRIPSREISDGNSKRVSLERDENNSCRLNNSSRTRSRVEHVAYKIPVTSQQFSSSPLERHTNTSHSGSRSRSHEGFVDQAESITFNKKSTEGKKRVVEDSLSSDSDDTDVADQSVLCQYCSETFATNHMALVHALSVHPLCDFNGGEEEEGSLSSALHQISCRLSKKETKDSDTQYDCNTDPRLVLVVKHGIGEYRSVQSQLVDYAPEDEEEDSREDIAPVSVDTSVKRTSTASAIQTTSGKCVEDNSASVTSRKSSKSHVLVSANPGTLGELVSALLPSSNIGPNSKPNDNGAGHRVDPKRNSALISSHARDSVQQISSSSSGISASARSGTLVRANGSLSQSPALACDASKMAEVRSAALPFNLTETNKTMKKSEEFRVMHQHLQQLGIKPANKLHQLTPRQPYSDPHRGLHEYLNTDASTAHTD